MTTKKFYPPSFIIGLMLTFVFLACAKAPKEEESKMEEKIGVIEGRIPKKQLRHVVLFKFKDSVSTGDITLVEKEFAALSSKISEIRDFEWGVNNSPEGLNKGFTHSFLVTFGSEEDRETYLPHPEHLAFVEIATPLIADVVVIDYWVTQ